MRCYDLQTAILFTHATTTVTLLLLHFATHFVLDYVQYNFSFCEKESNVAMLHRLRQVAALILNSRHAFCFKSRAKGPLTSRLLVFACMCVCVSVYSTRQEH